MSRDWDQHWMSHAHLAKSMGTCLTRQVGAVAVKDRRLLATGFNGNAPLAQHCIDGGCSRCTTHHTGFGELAGAELDKCVCVHAEVNVIAFAARKGIALGGANMYVTTRPCMDCTKLLSVAGLVTVIFDQEYPSREFMHPTLEVKQLAKSL